MRNQQRFEGPVLEDLLEEVRSELGPDVEIVEANKVRSGGIGGFFARESFEVVVAVDDDVSDEPFVAASSGSSAFTSLGDRPGGPSTLMDLVAAVEDGPAPSGPTTSPPGSVGDVGPLASEETVRALLEKTDEAPLPDPPPTGGEETAAADGVRQLLQRMSDRTPDPTSLPSGAGTKVSTDGDAFADVLTRITQTTTAPQAEPVRGLRTSVPARPSPLEAVQLERLGLPANVLPGALSGERFASLVQIAESFPTARRLPVTGDTVIAVVGDRRGMQATIAWIQESLGLAPEMLMLATRSSTGTFPEERRISDLEVASQRRLAWRRKRNPVLVAVDAPVGLTGTAWTRHVLDALEPSAVWGVIDAGRKAEDIVEWSERIGGLDALSVHGTDETTSPAAVVATGLPVSLLDGSPATPARWAALLDERLAVA